MNYVQLAKCRACHSENLIDVLDLGNQPLANALNLNINDAHKQSRYPLRLVQCKDCGLVQIDVNVYPALMFSDYDWVTGTSPSTMEYCKFFTTKTLQKLKKHPQSILEIGSNDGTLLKTFAHEEISLVVGVEPAENLTKDYESKIIVENLFFNSTCAEQMNRKYGKFDVVIARNVFSHIPDFNDVIFGVATLLDSESIFLMEFHWAHDILSNVHYDSIYHEHTYYHSILSVSETFEKFGLKIFDAFRSPISGGSVVVVASKKSRAPSSDLGELQKLESSARVEHYESWAKFGITAINNIFELRRVINSFAEKKICAFGASARSSTILNAIGSEAGRVISIADNNPRKWDKFSPGVGLPIESVEKMLSRNPDLIIVFPFNFKNEILEQLLKSRWSGSVLLPIPHPPQLIYI